MAKQSAATRAAYGAGDDDDDQDMQTQARTPADSDADTVVVGNSDADEGREVEVEIEVSDDDEKAIKEKERAEARDAYGDDDEDDERLAVDEDDDPPQQRRSRRARRNAQRRERSSEATAEIERLRQQVAQLSGGIASTQRGQVSLALNTVENQLRAALGALQLADAEIADAVGSADKERFAKAQRERDAAAERVMQLRSYGVRLQRAQEEMGDPSKMTASQVAAQEHARQPTPQAVANAERAEKDADIFLERNPWFNPDGNDRKSRMAKAIDEELAEEGYLTHTPAFWREFEKRTRDAGLVDDEEPDERPSRRQNGGRMEQPRQERRRGGPPTAAVRSNGRPGKATFTLHPDMVQYLEREGLDGPREKMTEQQRAKYDRITTAWRKGQQQLGRQA